MKIVDYHDHMGVWESSPAVYPVGLAKRPPSDEGFGRASDQNAKIWWYLPMKTVGSWDILQYMMIYHERTPSQSGTLSVKTVEQLAERSNCCSHYA